MMKSLSEGVYETAYFPFLRAVHTLNALRTLAVFALRALCFLVIFG